MQQAKVADFGMSKTLGQQLEHDDAGSPSGCVQHTLRVGTYRYMAPEVSQLWFSKDRRLAPYDESCDVYSLGLLLWEMMHNEVAFTPLDGAQAASEAARGIRPPMALAAPLVASLPSLQSLIAKCWCHEPAERISMPHCAEELFDMLARQPTSGSATDSSSRSTSSSNSWKPMPAEELSLGMSMPHCAEQPFDTLVQQSTSGTATGSPSGAASSSASGSWESLMSRELELSLAQCTANKGW